MTRIACTDSIRNDNALIDAFDKLSLSANRRLAEEFARMMEIAIAKIQLFGTTEEIRLVKEFLDEWADSQERTGQPQGNLDPLLNSLRNSADRTSFPVLVSS